jgi:methylmalonyl-CoA mutase cobalamin-binding subunit
MSSNPESNVVQQRGRSLGSGLAHLEARVPAPSIEAAGPRTEDERRAAFEDMGRDGFFAPEPEFPEALSRFRKALAAARASADPPFDPPTEFQPGHPSPH